MAGGVHRIDPSTLHVERYQTDAGLRSTDVGQIGIDPGGDLLVAGAAGLDRWNADERRFAPVPGSPPQRVLAFAFAPNGSLWLHTIGTLAHYAYRAGTLSPLDRFNATNGWPTLGAGGMSVDSAGQIWVSSARGLWRADPATRKIRLFGARDGLASAEFHTACLCCSAPTAASSAARLQVSSRSRLCAWLKIPRRHRWFSTASACAGTALMWLWMRGADAIELGWNDRDLRIAARALSYANPAANRYQWRLDGFEHDWVDTGNRGGPRVCATAARQLSTVPACGCRQWHLECAAGTAAPAGGVAAVGKTLGPGRCTRLPRPSSFCSRCGPYRTRIRRQHAFELAEQQRGFAERAVPQKPTSWRRWATRSERR